MLTYSVFCDVDGVLADLVGALCRVHGRDFDSYERGTHDIARVFGITVKELWEHPQVKGSDFWETLELLPWAEELVSRLETVFEGRVCLLTQPVRDADSLAGKARWIREHFPGIAYLVGPRKSVVSCPGAVLVDDSVKNILEWRASGGEGILFPAYWNSLHADALRPLEIVRGPIEKFAAPQTSGEG